uniref:S phase cyclin A-associated protein in the endoplasmic reticulum N-terminal domain-containing protein n=1 Tax=Strigamia maritima TaxID=126957 RepID=T1JIS4_STRMM
MVSVGVVDKVAEYFHRVHGPVDREQPFLLKCMQLMTCITNLHLRRNGRLDVFGTKKPLRECDSHLETHLESAFRATSLVNVVSLLYSILLHSGVPSRGSQSPPPRLSSSTINLAISGLRMLNHMALFHLPMFQSVLGDDALSLEFRHISTYLLWYYSASQAYSDEILTSLLHELLLTVGYFTVLNADHQTIIHSGHTPTLLQQLVTLPFPYFSDPRLTRVLFPTLIACCHNNKTNKTIIQQEMSGQLLSDFLQKALQDDPETDACCWESDPDWRWKTHFRFPRSRWSEANEFFTKND